HLQPKKSCRRWRNGASAASLHDRPIGPSTVERSAIPLCGRPTRPPRLAPLPLSRGQAPEEAAHLGGFLVHTDRPHAVHAIAALETPVREGRKPIQGRVAETDPWCGPTGQRRHLASEL